MWPRTAWKALYEPVIRRAAGLGEAPSLPDPDRYAQRYAHCDVLVIGAGPAGISAALTAADGRGPRHAVRRAGGIRRQPIGRRRRAHRRRLRKHVVERSIAALRANPGSPSLRAPRPLAISRTISSVSGERLSDHLPEPGASQPRERLWQVRARSVVLATEQSSAVGLPGQRSAGDLARGGGTDVSQSLRRACRQTGGHRHRRDAAYQTALDLHGRRRDGRWPSPMSVGRPRVRYPKRCGEWNRCRTRIHRCGHERQSAGEPHRSGTGRRRRGERRTQHRVAMPC